MDDVISKVQVDYVSTGADKAAADYNRVAQAEASLARSATTTATVTDSLSRSVLNAQRALDGYTRAHDPLSRAQADLARGERLAAAARAQGVETTDAQTRAMENARKRVDELREQIEGNTRSTRLNSAQAAELTHVAKSLFDEIAAGASPFRALSLEAGRVGQVFTSGQGGVGGTMKALLGTVSGLLSPTVLLTGAVVGLGVAGAAAFSAYESSQEKLATSLDGVGRRAGATLAQLNSVAQAGAHAGNITTSQATGSLADFTRAGLTPDISQGLLASAKTFGKATGTETDEAAKKLADAFADPTRGAADLDKALGLLDGRVQTTIDDLTAQGRADDARRVLLEALNKSLASTTDVTWGFGRAVEDAKNWLSDGFLKAGKFVSDAVFGGSLQEQLKFYQDQRPTTTSWAPGNFNTGTVDRRIADLQRMIAAEQDAPARAAAAKRDADASSLSLRADDIVREVLPDLVRAQSATNNISVLSQALNDPLVLSKMGVSQGSAQRAMGNLAVQASMADPLKAMAEDSKLAVQSIEAFTLAERVAVEARRAEIAVLRESGDVRKAALAAEIARNEEIAKANNAASDRLDQANQDRALVGLSPYARGRQEIRNQYEGVGGYLAKDAASTSELRDAMKPVAADLESAAQTIADALRKGAATITGATSGAPGGAALLSATSPYGTLGQASGSGALARAPASVFPMISDAADRTGIPASVIAAIGERENGFRLTGGTTMLGSNGRPSSAYGFGQLTNGAARDVAAVVPGFDNYNPSMAVFGSAEYLSILQKRKGGNLMDALNAYGGTPGYAADILRRASGVDAGAAMTVHGGTSVAPIPSTAAGSDRKAMSTQLSGYDEEQISGPLTAANQALKDQIALLNTQKTTVDQSAAQVQAAAEAQKLFNQYTAADPNHELGAAGWKRIADGVASYRDQLAKTLQATTDFQEQQQRLVAGMDLVRTTSRDALGTFVDDLVKGKGAGQAFADVLGQVSQKALSMAEDNLVQGLFGKTGTTQGGLLGGSGITSLFLSLFGLGHNATGTDDWQGGPTWVGERGPEIVNLPAHASVVPNGPATYPTPANGNSRDARPTVVNFNVTAPSPQAFASSERQVTAMLSRAVARGQRNG